MEKLTYILILFLKYFYPQKHNVYIFFNSGFFFSPIFIFIVSSILYFIMFSLVLQEKKIQKDILNLEARFVLYELIDHKLHVKDIYVTLFKVFIYITFTFLVYLGLRFYMLNSSYSLALCNLYNFFTLKNLIITLFFLLFLGMFRLFLHWILYRDVLRIYLYFSDIYNEYLVECITDFDFPSWRPGNFLRVLYFNLSLFFGRIAYGEKIFILFKKDMKNIFSKLYLIICFMEKYTKPVIQETAWITLLIALLYDITQEKLYYIYFASFIYLLRILYRKFGEFISQLDIFKDKTLYEYMYKTPYKPHIAENEARVDVINALEEKNGELTPEQQKEYNDILECYIIQFQMDGNRENFIEYVINDLVEYKITTEENIKVRKFIFLLMSFLCYIYLNIYTEIIITITINMQQISFQYHYIIMGLIIVNTCCWYKNNIKILNVIFWIISLIITLFTFMIFLNHNIPLMYTDILLDKYNIIIIDYYTIAEKISFIQHYLSFILQNNKETQEYLLKIIKDIPLTELLQKNTDLITMQMYVKNLILMHLALEETYKMWLAIIPKTINDFPEIYFFIRNSLLILSVSTTLINVANIVKVTYGLFYAYHATSIEIVKSVIKIFLNK